MEKHIYSRWYRYACCSYGDVFDLLLRHIMFDFVHFVAGVCRIPGSVAGYRKSERIARGVLIDVIDRYSDGGYRYFIW